jgi:hypothetical protein
MAKENSFDIVSTPDLSELQNAIDQTRRETATRYDFRGKDISVGWDASNWLVVLQAPEGLIMDALQAVLTEKCARRNVSLRFLAFGEPKHRGLDQSRVEVTIQHGIETGKAKEIQKAIRGKFAKIDVQIQGDALRVSSKSKDDLQQVMQFVRGSDFGLELNFNNFR